ncbi:hypothetical protein F3157_17570 [Virgibacillus dakarensis]|nr:hypothetical protein [Virgibacillus dakarensis]
MYYWIQKFEYDTPKHEISGAQWLMGKVDDGPINVTTGQEPVFIHFGATSVEVRPGANMAVLSDVVHVLQNQC